MTRTRRTLSLVASLALVMAAFMPALAFADDTSDNGDIGKETAAEASEDAKAEDKVDDDVDTKRDEDTGDKGDDKRTDAEDKRPDHDEDKGDKAKGDKAKGDKGDDKRTDPEDKRPDHDEGEGDDPVTGSASLTWDGQGETDCPYGYQFVLTPGGATILEASLDVDYELKKDGNGAWQFHVDAEDVEAGVTPTVTFTYETHGNEDPNFQFTSSKCLDAPAPDTVDVRVGKMVQGTHTGGDFGFRLVCDDDTDRNKDFELAHGEHEVLSLPAGLDCAVYEIEDRDADTTTVTVGGQDATNVRSGVTYAPFTASADLRVVFTNVFGDVSVGPESGAIAVTKSVTGNAVPSPTTTFGFTITCGTAAPTTFSLIAGETRTFAGLAPGTACTIVETETRGATSVEANGVAAASTTVNVAAGSTVPVTFVNGFVVPTDVLPTPPVETPPVTTPPVTTPPVTTPPVVTPPAVTPPAVTPPVTELPAPPAEVLPITVEAPVQQPTVDRPAPQPAVDTAVMGVTHTQPQVAATLPRTGIPVLALVLAGLLSLLSGAALLRRS
jgi:hypothetical protein